MENRPFFYITTPIYYVNGRPHIGHMYTTTAADTLARYRRLKGHNVFFLTGTDEHGQKVLEKANERGLTPKAHVDDMVQHWKSSFADMNISYDHFLRTTDESHMGVVRDVLTSLFKRDLIYKDTYTGWYSTAAERFWTEKDLVDGKCPDSGQAVEKITESNYFFRMSRFGQALRDHIDANPDFIRPVSRKNEVLGFLRKPLGDLCISRPTSRMSWGIEMPFDKDYVTYVWFDALLNYLSAIGFSLGKEGTWQNWWPADFHLIGKDILTTHAVYWTTMLMALEVPLPSCIYAHGWWTSTDGKKISKSLGNQIDTTLLAEEFGVDATRYFFLREIAFGADGAFSYETFMARYNADLANDLGNLVHRALSMTSKWLGGAIPAANAKNQADQDLDDLARSALETYDKEMEGLQFNKALEALWTVVKAGNKYVDTMEPWALNRNQEQERLATVMRLVLEVGYFAALTLVPVMPDKAAALLKRLGKTTDDAREDLLKLLAEPERLVLDNLCPGAPVFIEDPLFPRFREFPERIAALFEEPTMTATQTPEPKPATKAAPAPEAASPLIDFADFQKVQLRSGKIISADKHPNADRLLVLSVDVGEEKERTIVAGIANRFAPEDLIGRQVVVVVNLKPAKLRGILSEGMLLAAGGKNVVDLVSIDADPGEIVR